MTSVSSTSSSTYSYTNQISSIDWDALIDSAVNAKLAKTDSITTKITKNEAKITAYQKLQSLLSTVSTAAFALSAPSGSSNKSKDVFAARTAYLSTTGSTSASNIVGVAAANGTATGTYDLTVKQLATAEKVTSSVIASKTADLGYSGVFSLKTGDGNSVDITVSEDMSLAEVAEAINNSSSTSGVKATVLQVSSNQYRLVLTATATGKDITATAVSGDDVLNQLGITSSDGSFANVMQQAQSAIITIDGVEITRDSNEISDALDGVTFYLYSTTDESSSVSVEIASNLSDIADAVQSLVDAYNAYREYALTQQKTNSDGTASDDAALFGDGTLRSINSQLASALNTVIDTQSMALLGLSFDSSNYLELDTDTLSTALTDNLDAVKALLAFSFKSSSSDLGLIARGSSAPTSFTLDVAVADDGSLSASINGDSSLFTISGSRIIGKAGTAYEGFTFVYTGKTSQSVTVALSYGLADKLHNVANTASNSTSGTLQSLVSDLTAQDVDYQTKISDIESKAETYRTWLTARYAKYQAAIAEAASTLQYLQALLDAQNSSS